MARRKEAHRLRRLAERLAALDLIRPATELLAPSIQDRVRASPKAEAGADLAEFWLRTRVGDARALAGLRARFGPALRGEPGEPAFLVATMTAQRGTPDTAAVLAAAEERISRLEDYLAAAASKRCGPT